MSYKSQVIVHNEGFDASRFTDQTSLARAYMEKPDLIIPSIVFTMGSWADEFPLTFLSMGQQGGMEAATEVNNVEYEFPFIGKRKTTSKIVSHGYGSGDKIGLGFSLFFLVLEDGWMRNGQSIRLSNGKMVRVAGEPVPVGGHMRYSFQLMGAANDAFLDFSELTPGTFVSAVGGVAVTQSNSLGNYGHSQYPGKKRNQISILRQSYRLAGNISNKVVEFRLMNKSGGTTNLFIDWYEYQQMIEWMAAKEEHLWTSLYNRNENGVITHLDPVLNQPIPYGAGVMQQIVNQDTYSKLTDKKISTVIGDIFRGASDYKGNKDIIMYTGQGGMIEFDNAMKESRMFKLVADNTGDKFVTTASGGLRLGGYFRSYEHIDGNVITVKKLPMLDTGGYANNSPLHPETGLPLTGYEFYFLDQSRYDGVPNVKYIYEKGRMEIRGLEQGMSLVKGQSFGSYNGNGKYLNLSTEQDATSIHFLATCGIQIFRDTHCFKLLPSIS